MVENKIIDLQEKVLTKDEIEKDYVDIKQASQIMNNVSTRTAYRYIDAVSETKGVNVRTIDIVSNGGKKKLYLKEDIITVSKILNKDKTVLVHVPYSVNDNGVNDTRHSESSPSDVSHSGKAVKEVGIFAQDTANQLVKKIEEGFASINELKQGVKEYKDSINELNNNIRTANGTVQGFMTKLVEQGIDLKEKYLEDRIKRTEIERQQAETSRQQAETLRLLLEKSNGKNSINSQTLLIVFLILVIAVGGGWFFISTAQQRLEKQFEERLDQEKQIQTAQYETTMQQLKDSLAALTTANQTATMPQPAGQGAK
jgi:hypothetical protein